MNKKAIKKAGAVLLGAAALCLTAAAALCLISGVFMKQSYKEPWSKQYAAKFPDPRVRLSAVGLLAASNHNMQPWKIKLDPSDPAVFYLYADSSRKTDKVDPLCRQMMISQGTFLGYVEIAGEETGWRTDIRLFPDGVYDETDLSRSMDSKPVAKITLSKAQAEAAPLYGGIFLPDTNRDAYKKKALTAAQAKAFEALSPGSGVSVRLFDGKKDLGDIGGYALRSAAVEAGVARVMEESNAIFRANEYQKNKYRYGYSVEGQGAAGLQKHLLQGVLTLFPELNEGKAASRNFIRYTQASVESTPAYAMIVTAGNSRAKQVESGILYSRLVLTGHSLGLAMQPLSQVLEEYPEMKPLYGAFRQTYAPNGGTVQMLFRVGIPTRQVPLSMRRDVRELLMA